MNEIRNQEEIRQLLIESEALLEGHFLLSSGMHSNRYVQCAKFFQDPCKSRKSAMLLKEYYQNEKIDLVIGGAFGGIILSYELAAVFGVRNIFAERNQNGVFEIRRGFDIRKGENVLIAEDVVTTGKSILEVIELVKSYDGNIIGIASLIDRHQNEPEKIPYRIEWLHSVVAESFTPEQCPLCEKGLGKPVKPGSRKQ